MLNNVVMVGQIYSIPKNKELDFILEVKRSYLNSNGVYDSDFLKCVLWPGIRENLILYCKIGDVIAIKARLESIIEKKEEVIIKEVIIVVERLVFLKKNYCSNSDCDKIK